MKKISKTNAMRFLDQHKIAYEVLEYAHKGNEAVDGVTVATSLNEDVEAVYKTLVTTDGNHQYYVFMIAVNHELDLKKCAKAAQVKHLDMIPVKDINKITGYIRGGCSPLAMKKDYPTFIDEDVILQDQIYFSAGKIGLQICMHANDLIKIRNIQIAEFKK